MPKIKSNQSDDDKGSQNHPISQLDLNASHKLGFAKEEVYNASRCFQADMQPIMQLIERSDKEILAKFDEGFDNIASDANKLDEKFKKLSLFKIMPYEDRYKIAIKKVALTRLRFDSDIIAKNKRLFIELEEALDNTFIIKAYPQDATLFKVGVLYHLYQHAILMQHCVEMSIALRVDDLPDEFKYIEEQNILRKAKWIELGQQAYQHITKGVDEDAKDRFSQSCAKFLKIYNGLIETKPQPKPINLSIEKAEIDFPTIPTTNLNAASSNPSDMTNPIAKKGPIYCMLNEPVYKKLIAMLPQHKKDKFSIPEIGGIPFDTLMRTCLSKQISVNESSDIRKRTAADKYLHRISHRIAVGLAAMDEDKRGVKFNVHGGFVNYNADPKNINQEINKEYADYQKELIINQECKLTGLELVRGFFRKLLAVLEKDYNAEKDRKYSEYKKNKKSKAFFDRERNYRAEEQANSLKYQQLILEVQELQQRVEKAGPENCRIFAPGENAWASYSVPKIGIETETTSELGAANATTMTTDCQNTYRLS